MWVLFGSFFMFSNFLPIKFTQQNFCCIVMCIYLLFTFAISNVKDTLLHVGLEDSTLGDLIVLKKKKVVIHWLGLCCYTMFPPRAVIKETLGQNWLRS